jgi:Asp/Glu/hydantoin racemase
LLYHSKNRQVSYGEAIGILLLDSPIPFIPGDVANATTYDFPVRFKRVAGFSVKKALGSDESIYQTLLDAARNLKENGVRAVTGDCGFMAVHQKRLKQDLGIPVFLSSLFQIPFIRHILPDKGKIGIITASAQSLTPSFLETIGIKGGADLVIGGLEHAPEFKSAVLDEKGSLDTNLMTKEVVSLAKEMTAKENQIAAILLECSVLPPYARAISEETGLPVFDYITMVNYLFSALVKKSYTGFM